MAHEVHLNTLAAAHDVVSMIHPAPHAGAEPVQGDGDGLHDERAGAVVEGGHLRHDPGRGSHSSTLRLNLSAFCVTGGAGMGSFGGA